MFKIFRKAPAAAPRHWYRQWSDAGVSLSRAAVPGGAVLDSAVISGYLTQLSDEGLAAQTEQGFVIGWDALLAALESDHYAGLANELGLPPLTNARPTLVSSESLGDESFSIAIGNWHMSDGRSVRPDFTGAVLRDGDAHWLLPRTQWALVKDVLAFARRDAAGRTDVDHREAWGRIRKLAIAANARMDDFLYRTVVLTPEKLLIGLRRSEAVSDDRVIEVAPSFEGAPSSWLEMFDRSREVRDRYDVLTNEGIVQVMITPKVRTVLQEIKRLPGRRVAGSRAEAFLLNPFATLGSDAVDVIEEAQFEKAREDAGLQYERFTPTFVREATGYPTQVGLLVETATAQGPTSSETSWLDDSQLQAFCASLERALTQDHQLLAWNGYDFELQGDSASYLQELKAALEARRAPRVLVSYAQVHDLSGYSTRIEGIGVETPYYSPYIAKRNEDGGWFPDNVFPVVVYKPRDGEEPVAVPTNKEAIERLKKAVEAARLNGKTEVECPGIPNPMPVGDAENIVSTFDEVFKDLESGKPFDPEARKKAGNNKPGASKQLILRANIQTLDYEEGLRAALEAVPARPELPSSINPAFSLLPHQQEGLAWLQHLYGLRDQFKVRGAVLADDMGLGKTFQLLSLMAWLLERDPEIAPMLVVAPVSLLENWAEEAAKFFKPGALPILTAYGDRLAQLRVPRSQIDTRLQSEDRLVKFLRPNWVSGAKLVLTTYETMRDLEFSFAAQRWSVMVCDEAQRIKNPAAMVTRAAKKQNVSFRIACTGTPVENTLADLWCLFDYVQPGLLGALNDFGQRYRKPIEAKTEEERARVEELRARIAPQILRRLKSEVATDLPPKVVDERCRKLLLSSSQRNLYAKAIDSFKKRNEPQQPTPFKNHLGLLHYLRVLCTDPRPHGLSVFKPEPPEQYRDKAPKLNWLIVQLHEIKRAGEKVIVFCEFREIQRLLQHYIEAEFGFRPDIINGDTSAASSHTASRQKRIKAFQEASGFGVLILSPVAVGFGVNIQAANHVVHYTRTWNPAKEDQATDRAYRIGQRRPVYVYYPVVYADDFVTFDVKLDQLLAYKRSLAEDMLNGSGDLTPGDFNIADVVPGADATAIDERVTLDLALQMDWRHVECLAAVLWTKQGYGCYRTPDSNDNGVDVVAIAGEKGQLIQVKTRSAEGKALNWDAVKDVVTGEAYYRKRHPAVKEFQKVCLTNQFFNAQAQENGRLNDVRLIDQHLLRDLLEQHPTMMLEVEQMLYTQWDSASAA